MCTKIIPTWEVPYRNLHQVDNSETAHGCSSHCRQLSAVKRIIIHLLYGAVQFPKVEPEQCTYALCTQIVPTFRSRSALYTRCTTPRPLKAVQHTVHSNLQRTEFHTHAVEICTVLRSRTGTVHLGCVYKSCIYLIDPVAHCTPGVQLRQYTRQFTTPYTAICNELNIRTHAVRICAVSEVGPEHCT